MIKACNQLFLYEGKMYKCPLCKVEIGKYKAGYFCDKCSTEFKLIPQTCPSCKGWGVSEYSSSEGDCKSEPKITALKYLKCYACHGSRQYEPKPVKVKYPCESCQGEGHTVKLEYQE